MPWPTDAANAASTAAQWAGYCQKDPESKMI
jgi:hypothetical protein